jgi:hypothetical protein
MPDFNQILMHVEAAERELKQATDSMVPIDKIRQVDAYVLGILRGGLVLVRAARDAIMQSADFQRASQGHQG